MCVSMIMQGEDAQMIADRFVYVYIYCMLCWPVKGYNSALYAIKCELVVMDRIAVH